MALRSGSSLARPQPKPSPCPTDRSAATHAGLQNAPLPLARLRAVCNEQPHSSQSAGQRSNLLTHSNTSSPSSAADLTHTRRDTINAALADSCISYTKHSVQTATPDPNAPRSAPRRASPSAQSSDGKSPTGTARHGTTGSYCGAGGDREGTAPARSTRPSRTGGARLGAASCRVPRCRGSTARDTGSRLSSPQPAMEPAVSPQNGSNRGASRARCGGPRSGARDFSAPTAAASAGPGPPAPPSLLPAATMPAPALRAARPRGAGKLPAPRTRAELPARDPARPRSHLSLRGRPATAPPPRESATGAPPPSTAPGPRFAAGRGARPGAGFIAELTAPGGPTALRSPRGRAHPPRGDKALPPGRTCRRPPPPGTASLTPPPLRARPRPYRRRTPTATPAGRAAPHLPPRSAPRRGAPPAPSRPAPAPPPPNRSPPPAEAAPLSRPAGSERRPGPPPAGGAEPSGGPESPLAAGGRGPGRAGLGSRRGRARSGAEWPRVVPNEGRAVQPRWAASALCRPGGAVPQQQVAEEPHGPARRLGSAAQGAGIVTKAPLPAAPQRRGDGGTEAKRGTRPTRPGGRHKAQRTAPRSVGNGSARPRRSRARFAGLRCDLCAAPRRAALPGLVPTQRPAVTRRAAGGPSAVTKGCGRGQMCGRAAQRTGRAGSAQP